MLSGIGATAWLIGPAFLALIIVIAVYPVQGWLRRHDWPGWLTNLVMVVLVIGVLVGFVLVVVGSLAQLPSLLPRYANRADELPSRSPAAWRASAWLPHRLAPWWLR